MSIPCAILGATGYVGGELLRLVLGHPELTLVAASSAQDAGTAIADHFPHLAPLLADQAFVAPDALTGLLPDAPAAVFSALPHGTAAHHIDALLQHPAAGHWRVVDASADFRLTDPAAFEAIYGQPHAAPERLREFVSAVPEFHPGEPSRHAAQPGCFATAMQLAIVPLLELRLAEPAFYCTGITGSTGAGKTPLPTTHMPERHANLFAYKPLDHRHAPEVEAQVEAATGERPDVHFVPHAGPFARGIHMTVMARTAAGASASQFRSALDRFYAPHPFVRVADGLPRMKQVTGSNHAALGVACARDTVCVTVVIDNLLKGAAGGALQWMNRLFGWPETAGLTATATGWS